MTQVTFSVTIEEDSEGEFLDALFNAGFYEVVWFGKRYALTKEYQDEGGMHYSLTNVENPKEIYRYFMFTD